MIYIQKKKEPDQFLQYRRRPGARFDDMDFEIKEQLRESLLKEQGCLCAYCMRRIHDRSDVKIEHLEARTLENELQYHNLLAVCKGGEGGPPKAQSCDTKKGSRPISINPLDKASMSRVYYKSNGEIHSSDPTEYRLEYKDSTGEQHERYTTQDKDICECLNLNYINGAPLMGRKAALRKFQQKLHPYKDRKSKKAFLEKAKQIYSQRGDYMEPYVGILRWYIDDKLRKL